MATQLLHSMSCSRACCSSRIGVTKLGSDAGKILQIVQGDRFENSRTIHAQKCGTSHTVRGLRGNHQRVLHSIDEIYRREGFQACRSMMHDDDNGTGRSSGHIGDQCGAGGETNSECVYVKRNIGDGEIVEHSGSVVILGDVKPGGFVSAGGDVIVIGRLQGTVQAGRAGNRSANVFTAFHDSGTIKIGDEATLKLSENEKGFPHIALLASDGRILIRPATEEPYQRQNSLPEKRPSLMEHSQETVDGVKAGLKHSATQSKESRNIRPAQVALFTGIYISVAGLVLFAFPKLFGLLFDLQSVSLGWIQVGAVLAVVFGVYYIGTAVGDMRSIQGAQAFYYSTVVGRIFLFLSFTWLVVVGAVPSALLFVGVVNLVGAALMWRALREKRKQGDNI